MGSFKNFLSLKILFFVKVVQGICCRASSDFFMERTYKSRGKYFTLLPVWESCSNSEWEYVILGFVYSYSADSRFLILSRGFGSVGKVMLNFFNDNGDKEQSFCFMKNYGLIHLFSKEFV